MVLVEVLTAPEDHAGDGGHVGRSAGLQELVVSFIPEEVQEPVEVLLFPAPALSSVQST